MIAEKFGLVQSAVPKHINENVTGREKCGRKRCTRIRDLAQPWEKLIQKLGGASQSREDMHLWERGYSCRIPNQTTPNQRRHQKVNDLKVNTAIWKSGGREERHRIQGFWGPVWSSCSLCWFRSPCHLLVLVAACPLLFIKSRLHAAFYQEIAEHFVLLLADTLYGDVNFLFQLGFLPTLPTLPPHHLILLIGQPTCLMLIPLEIYKLL